MTGLAHDPQRCPPSALLRQHLIDQGLIKEHTRGDVTPTRTPATLKLDDAGRREAQRRIRDPRFDRDLDGMAREWGHG
jgi:hypothetical protein